MLRTVLFVVALVAASPVFAAPNHAPTVPQGAELSRFPVVAGEEVPKTAKQEYELEAKLGLRPIVLRTSLKAFNHYRRDNSWRYEEIGKGAIVLVDSTGIIRYKADCWNRLVVERSWLDGFLAWGGGMIAEWFPLLIFAAGFTLGTLWRRRRPHQVIPAPPHPANQ